MRHIATLVLAALVVAGTLPAVGAAAAQHGTDAQYTTDLGDVQIVAGELGTDGAVVANADGTAADATITDYRIPDRTLAGDEPLRLGLHGSGEGSTPIVLTVDGERVELGTATVDGERVAVEPNGDLAAEPIIEDVDCEGEYNSWDDWWIRCEITFSTASFADGSHDVGVNGLEPTTVAVGDDLEVTGYEFVDGTNSPVNETETLDSAVTVFRNNTVRNTTTTLAIRGTGVGETPLVLSVDGERTRLGTLSVTPDGASLEAAAATDPPSLHCEFGYDEDEGWYFRCELDLGVATLDGGGDHGTSVSVNDLEPTQVDVQPHEAQLAGYEIRNDTVRTGGTVQMTTTFEGKTGEVPVVLTVDGQQFRAGTVTVEDGRVQSVQTADASAAPIGFVPCPDLQDDDPLVIVWCASDIPTVAQGSHDVGVNGVEPTEVTVESRNPGPFGPIDDLGDVLDLLLDGLFGG